MPIVGGSADGRRGGVPHGSFASTLQTAAGASQIQRIVVRFKDGTTQVVRAQRMLDARNPIMEVILEGNRRRIDSIRIVGSSRRNAAIQVFAI